MKKSIWIITLLLIGSRVIAQTNNYSKVWVLGESANFTVIFDGAAYPVTNVMDTTKPLLLSFGHSSICDSTGQLILLSNGGRIYNQNRDIIDGGDSLIPDAAYAHYGGGYSGFAQGSIFLPIDSNRYYFITNTATDSSEAYWLTPKFKTDLLLYNVIDMNENGGAGKVVKRKVPILQGDSMSASQMMACRHGNGKDWWLLKQAKDTNIVYEFLFTQDSMYGPYIQGFSEPHFGLNHWQGQSTFSQDGTKYATVCSRSPHIFLTDFDRCSGLLSNPKVYDIPAYSAYNPANPDDLDTLCKGLSFSPNGRFLYVATISNIQQLDLEDTSSITQWHHVAAMDTTFDQFQGYSIVQIGNDGKEYIGNWGSWSSYMDVINAPDSKGVACDFCPRCLEFPAYHVGGIDYYAGVSQPPTIANYALGPDPDCPEAVNHVATQAAAVRVFPNPSTGFITIEYPEAGSIEISNALGQVLFTTTLSATFQSATVDLGKLPAGIYTYRYLSADGKIQKAGKLSLIR